MRRAHLPGVAHAHAAFGADQRNAVSVHPAQGGGIHGKLRAPTGIVGFDGDNIAIGIGPVVADRDGQIAGLQAGVDFHRAGNQPGVILPAAVHPAAADSNAPAIDVVTRHLAVFQPHVARRQRTAPGVDKTAAAAGDARRVGDNHVGFFARHLDEAAQLAGVHAIDFIEDNFGTALRQPRIARHLARQLRRRRVLAVVQYGAALADVELAVLVVGKPLIVRGLNVDLRQAVAALHHGGLLSARRAAIGHNAARLRRRAHQPGSEPQRQRQRPQYGSA
ncbi:Uncharacterised protein [Klebsiella pneumoniae]|nr:Uncharacterised protein [Klebsiella pneumoniae]